MEDSSLNGRFAFSHSVSATCRNRSRQIFRSTSSSLFLWAATPIRISGTNLSRITKLWIAP